nr:uncharacterized protein LOC113689547 [Coffea arabica]
MENPVHHFRHPHPLSLRKFNQPGRKCHMCQRQLDLDATVYGCERCSFFLVCSEKIKHGIYHCEETNCPFDLDLGCAALTPSKKYADRVAELQGNHQHALILCDKPNEFYDFYYCYSRCYELIVDDKLIFACLECKCLLDESCAAQGREIKHPFHPDHPLKLQPVNSVSSAKCSVCASTGFLFVFQCSLRDFVLDLDCSKLKPRTNKIGSDEEIIKNQFVSHPHPLIQCDTSGISNYQARCYGCGLHL